MGGETFHRDPEWLYGEGIGASRGPLVQLEFALRALKSAGKLKSIPMGVMVYADEGRDCDESAETHLNAMGLIGLWVELGDAIFLFSIDKIVLLTLFKKQPHFESTSNEFLGQKPSQSG